MNTELAVIDSVCDQEPCLVARLVRVNRDPDRLPPVFMFSNLSPPDRFGLCHLWSHAGPSLGRDEGRIALLRIAFSDV